VRVFARRRVGDDEAFASDVERLLNPDRADKRFCVGPHLQRAEEAYFAKDLTRQRNTRRHQFVASLPHRRIRPRQNRTHHCPLAFFRFHNHATTMLFDDFPHNRQSKTRTSRFRCEKRIENLRQYMRIYPRTRIPNPQPNLALVAPRNRPQHSTIGHDVERIHH
jgi:hypothetical protein